ncbi:MAG: hypothetical protein QW745_00760 [Thermoplasmata archaeon]
MKQISFATNTNIDMNLAGRRLIRLEGSTHEITNKPCSQIISIPNDRHANYPVKIPDSLPPKLWNISFLEDELNAYLKIYFSKKEKLVHYRSGQLIEHPEKLTEILKPVYLKGHRHFIILAFVGYLRRHQDTLDTALKIVRELAIKDEERTSRIYNLTQIYKADNNKRIPGLPRLLEIIRLEAWEGKISEETAKTAISQLEGITSKNKLKTIYILRNFKMRWKNRILVLQKKDLLNTDEKLVMHLQSISVAKILNGRLPA